MMERPAHRPSFETLAGAVKEKTDPAAWPDESDAQTRAWAREFFGAPGVAGPPEPDVSEEDAFGNLLAALGNVSLWGQ